MNSAGYRARRATMDDLEALRKLWASMRHDVPDLEKRLTEFQVAEDPAGQLIGAVGFQIAERNGCIHNEAFADFSLADPARLALWDRIQALCLNHGVVRLWTRERAPFWTRNGLLPAGADVLPKLPATWDRAASDWLTLRLKDEAVIASLDKEFALFAESEKRSTAQTLEQTRALRRVLLGICVLIILVLGSATLYFLLTRRPPGPSVP